MMEIYECGSTDNLMLPYGMFITIQFPKFSIHYHYWSHDSYLRVCIPDGILSVFFVIVVFLIMKISFSNGCSSTGFSYLFVHSW